MAFLCEGRWCEIISVCEQLKNILDNICKDDDYIIDIPLINGKGDVDVREEIQTGSSGNKDG